MDDTKKIPASELAEGMEIFNGVRWLILEEVEIEGDEVRLWSDCGFAWTLRANDEVTVPTFPSPDESTY